MMRKKLRCRKGLTLAETLAALGVFAIFSVVLMYGVTAAWKVYSKAVVASEARTLQSTLTQALSNELRYAENIQVGEGGKVVYDSQVFGADVSVTVSSEGRVQIGTEGNLKDLLGDKTYTSGLKVNDAKVTYDATTGVFTVMLTITQDAFLPDGIQTKLTIQALNAPAPAS